MINAARKPSATSALGALLRLVRGGFHEDGQEGLLSRRRRDRHPDAPPRPPLFASRDLPAHESAEQASVTALDVAPVEDVIEAPVEAEPQFVEADIVLPRAPEPLSDAEIADAMAVIAARNEQVARPASVLHSFHRDNTADLVRALDLPLIENVSLAQLANRFEQGIAKREAVVHAEDAQHSLSSSIAYAQPDDSVRTALRAHRPVELVHAAVIEDVVADDAGEDPAVRVDEDVEQALNNALATLRKLTEQGRP